MAENIPLNVSDFVAETVGNALWVRGKMADRWPLPHPAMKRIGRGSEVWILKVIHEEPAVLIVDEWGHMQWVTIDSVVVEQAVRAHDATA